jgi:hypothetical protein
MATKKDDSGEKLIASNRKAFHDYFVGVVLANDRLAQLVEDLARAEGEGFHGGLSYEVGDVRRGFSQPFVGSHERGGEQFSEGDIGCVVRHRMRRKR